MPSPEFATLLRQLRLQPPAADATIEELRAGTELMTGMMPLPPDVYWEGAKGRIRAEWVTTFGATSDRAILYLHGGGFVTGSPPGYRELASRLSRGTASPVLVLDYRLAPEAPFPAALEDTYAAWEWLLGQNIDPGRVAFVGDSAGGGLALAAAISIRDAGGPLPAAAVCFSPWVDLERSLAGGSVTAEDDPVLHPDLLRRFAEAYLGGMDPRAPLASPIHASLEGLPPLLVQSGTADLLHAEAIALATRAREAGVAIVFEPWEEMIHVWQLFAGLIPEGRQAVAKASAFLRHHLDAK